MEGDRTGDECAVKMFKIGSVFEESFFTNDLKVVEEAANIISSFNGLMGGVVKRHILLNRPQIWTQCTGERGKIGQKMLVETKIRGVALSPRDFKKGFGRTEQHEPA